MTTILAGSARRRIVINNRNLIDVPLLAPNGLTLQAPNGDDIIVDRLPGSGSGGRPVVVGGGTRTSTVTPRT